MNREHQSRYLLPLILGAICLSTPALPQTASAGDRGERRASNVGPSATMRRHTRLESVARPDDLGTYMEDLSAFGTSARVAMAPADIRESGDPARAVDLVALRAWIRSSGFPGSDDLGTYMEDYAQTAQFADSDAARRAAPARKTLRRASVPVRGQDEPSRPATDEPDRIERASWTTHLTHPAGSAR